MKHSTEKKVMDLENTLVVAKGGGVGVGSTGSLGLWDANYCFWNGSAMRSCCVALRTMSSHLWWNMIMGEKKNVYMYVLCNRKKNYIGEIIGNFFKKVKLDLRLILSLLYLILLISFQ